MIVMEECLLHDQAGMEQALRRYFDDVKTQCPGTLNAMLDARLLSVDFDRHILVLEADMKPWMTNPNGIVHGGITAAYLDLVMGLLCRYCSGGRMTPTLHMDVSYLRTISARDTICVRAEIAKLGSTICTAVGSIYAGDRPDRLLATATGSYIVQP